MELLNTKRGQISGLQGFFLTMMMLVIFVGLTFIIADKFLDATYKTTSGGPVVNETLTAVNRTVVNFATTETDINCGTVTDVRNLTGGVKISSGNYTQWNCGINFTSSAAGDIRNFGGHNWNVTYSYTYSADTYGSNATSNLSDDLYTYGVGFLGIIILVVMVYLIISIVSGRKQGAR